MQKNALSVQSLACHGKCSLTEALPLVSANGISLSVLPTVVLSTHTGGFGTPEKIDTTEFFKKAMEHFKSENIKFDGIYTGYFADKNQIDVFLSQIEAFKKEGAIVLIDPVLGDNGKLFSGITEDCVSQMLLLCQKADIITPNLTEARLLAGENCDIIDLSLRLYNKTHAKVVITGIEKENKIGVSIFNGEKIQFVFSKRLKQGFHGTGDIFAAIVFSNILKGKPLKGSVKSAVKFISKAIKNTASPERDGLDFENLI